MDSQIHLNNTTQFDFIIAGAGCAGLSLLYHILQSPSLKEKQILIVDKSFQKSNDRTWCFWEQGEGDFEILVNKQWEHISVHNGNFNKTLATDPFTYKMIQGIDYYKYIIDFAKTFHNVHWREAHIVKIETGTQNGIVHFESGKTAVAPFVFSSIVPEKYQLAIDTTEQVMNTISTKQPFLWQHFKGIIVEFDMPVFDTAIARLMDFNVPQEGATAFMYVLPINTNKALIEYTLFSEKILSKSAYNAALLVYLDKYITNNNPNAQYKITHEEFGAIPMTHFSFSTHSNFIYPIGTLSGAVKASTGYAFQFIQAQSKQIVNQIEKGLPIDTSMHKTRHRFYDAVLLYILKHHKMEGKEIFTRIFKKNKAATIFKFLSNTSNFIDDINVMRSLPTRIFLPAAIRVLFRRR